MVFISDAIFSELLKNYPELWGQGKGYIPWKDHGGKLADELAKRTGRLITGEDVKLKLQTVRQSLKRLNKSKGTAYASLRAYVWYAQKLRLTNAVDKMTSQVRREKYCRKVRIDTDCVGFDKKQTEKQTEDRPFTTESPDRYISSNYYSDNVNRDIDDIYDEGPATSAEVARRGKAQSLEPVVNPEEADDIKVHQIIGSQPIPNVQTEECITEDLLENTIKREESELEIFPSCSNSSGSENDSAPRTQSVSVPQSQNEPDEEADIEVHQIIGGQPIPNIQTEECITEDLLENTIKREEPELEIFPSCSNSSGSENDSAPRSQNASVPQSQNEPASPICSKETETKDYRKQILNELRKCNEQIHNEIVRKKDFERKKLQLEEEKIMLLREYVNSVKDIKTIFENYLNKN